MEIFKRSGIEHRYGGQSKDAVSVTVSLKDARKLYNETSDAAVKELFERWFGDDIKVVPKDVMSRVKTFQDACSELGKEHPFVAIYEKLEPLLKVKENYLVSNPNKDILAFLMLRIITAALNEESPIAFSTDKNRYMPAFNTLDISLYKAKHLDEPMRTTSLCDNKWHSIPGNLVLKNEILSLYSASQFTNIWIDLNTRTI